ncbi:MAG: hypothetical protein JWM27_4600 [Gemmatimonadetes bacterium]|nr:hypothetical protein [Gemmatimonadota bacterium]
MRHLWPGALLLALACAAHPLAAQQKGAEGVARRLKEKPDAAWSRGMSPVGASLTGALGADGSARFSVNLTAGRTYAVIGLCDADCHDLDLRLFDPDGVEANADVEPDDAPYVLVTPRRTGAYQVRAYMAECRSATCAFGIQLFVRQAR